MAAGRRIRQGLRALLAFARPVMDDRAADCLTAAELAVFRRLSRAERQHSLNVLETLVAGGPVPRELAVAALLHDAGKTRYPLAVWMKTLAVLLKAFAPVLARRWSEGDPRHLLRRGLVVAARHPDWSAELAAAAGAPELAVWLIRHHQDDISALEAHPGYPLLRRLQAADNAN